MDSEALKQRISQGEDSSREFKSAVKAGYRLDPDTIAKEIAALANSGGGELILGVEDDGTVTGLGDSKQADQILALVAQSTQQNLHPPLWCALHKVAFAWEASANVVTRCCPLCSHVRGDARTSDSECRK